MTTTQIVLSGTSGDGGRTRTYTATRDDDDHPGKSVAMTWVYTRMDDGALHFTYREGEGANAWTCLDLVYRRTPAASAQPSSGR